MSITKRFYAVFHKCLNIYNERLLVKSRVTLERTKEEQGCLRLNYLSKEPISTICLKIILRHHHKKKVEIQNQLSRYGKIKGKLKAISTFSLSVKIENLELHYF